MKYTLQSGIRSLRNIISPQNALYDKVAELIKNDNKRRISLELTKNRTYKAEMQQDELRLAIEHAEDPMRPDRTILLAIYKEVMRDPHLLSQIRTNILKVIGSPWALFKEGTDTIDEEATRLLQKEWFQRYRYEFHLAKYYGHSLIEFQHMRTSKVKGMELEFKSIKVFPREHVRPETGEILIDPNNERGIPYREDPWNTWLVEIGDPFDLGLLNIAAREVIWKNYSRTDWSRMCEKFGLPLLAIKAATRNEDELAALEEMAANFGSNLWVILDDEDEVEIKERKGSDGHKIFEDKVRFCDEQNSKLISGQTGTSDQKAYVGAAQVQENILNEYMEEAMRNETFHNNDDLKDFLIKHGYPLDGLEFRYLAFNKEEDDGNQPPGNGGKKPTANFTKPSPKFFGEGLTGLSTAKEGTFSFKVDALYSGNCCTHQTPEASGGIADLEKLANEAALRIYNKKLKAGGIDKKLWLATVNELWQGVTKGYGKNLPAVKYGSPDHIMLTQLRYNTQVFAAFKNHHNVNELAKALLDDKGNVRSFSQFKNQAGLINKKYNKNWIRTEHNQAIQSGRNAERWQKLEATKDIFPNAIYKAVNDGNTSQICQDLNGGIWAIDDPVLDTIAPSNHWGCRSFLQKTRQSVSEKETGEDIRKEFKTNVGKSGNPFSDKHPYYKLQEAFKKEGDRVFGLDRILSISPTDLARNLKLWESLDPKDYKKTSYPESGGFTAVHKLADKSDLKDNLATAKIMAKNGYAVEIRKHIEDGTPNPEFLINGVLSDLKTPKKPYSLDSRLQKAVKKQGLNNVVYKIKGSPTIEEINNGLKRGFTNRKKIEWIDIVNKSKTLRITREMYSNRAILKELRKIWP